MDRIEFIRKEEKEYHDFCYDHYKLFEAGSWLHKPVKTVIDLIPLLADSPQPMILDLGAGVGRNSIPLAKAIKEKEGKVICVDLLDSALEKLVQYSEKYQVNEVIQTVKADIEHYPINPDEFDLIVAVSSLEHVRTEAIFTKTLERMAKGTKENGINCIIVNSEVEEINIETNEKLDALIELNIPTNEMIKKLQEAYLGWKQLDTIVKRLEYKIVRNEKPVLLKTNAITFVVSK
ncbi:class I SAM-dependent methyltransferase [Bacillus sp. FJAT-50079]|uniref:class I SAM-dependent methyltransferase n=1 Tax=Bacillus sp. FJAT-50079 TaxID=2833577 RepID=UPI001BC8D3DB|nr:class I SAM-dependent methyltransferase [Bacillus sp. FJAT-50079]MBS4209435.1 class I SAM-dependent methyltransferase [Bacillus sp. FJAT-50079]